MVSLVSLIVALTPAYDAITIEQLDSRRIVGRAFVTKKGVVAGYRFGPENIFGPHGLISGGTPFVWADGVTVPLPLDGATGGQVHFACDSAILGSTSKGAAEWTPSEKNGWKEPQLRILQDQGSATFMDNMGSIYLAVAKGQRILSNGKVTDTAWEDLSLVGVDDRGRWFINKTGFKFSDAIGVPNRSYLWSKSDRQPLLPAGYDRCFLECVNGAGTAVGKAFKKTWRAGLWNATGFHELPCAEGDAEASSINEKGWIVGRLRTKDGERPILWKEGVATGLSGVIVGGAVGINDQGAILVEGGEVLTLLKPRL